MKSIISTVLVAIAIVEMASAVGLAAFSASWWHFLIAASVAFGFTGESTAK